MINFKDVIGDRVRMTTYRTNEDETITRKMYWVNEDGTEEIVSEQVLQKEDIYQSLQDTFNE